MKNLSVRITVAALATAGGVFAAGCMGAGDTLTCPECDNVTRILVGDKCVPVGDVSECGPDGHCHGDECHCFSGQEPTGIGGVMYCLQQDCAADKEDILGHLDCDEHDAHEHDDEHDH